MGDRGAGLLSASCRGARDQPGTDKGRENGTQYGVQGVSGANPGEKPQIMGLWAARRAGVLIPILIIRRGGGIQHRHCFLS